MLRRARNPEGRMPLRAHLVELRNRMVVSGVAVVVMGVVGWVVYEPLVNELVRPIVSAGLVNDMDIELRFASPTQSFDMRLKLSLWLGVIGSSPVWLWQTWRFITPGLTSKERWYSLGFLSASVPLFLAGVTLAWFVLPNAFIFLTSLNPDQVGSLFDFSLYVSFVTRVALFFGIAFLLPVVMVGLNMAGLVSARAMLRAWRYAIVLAFVFAAIASPTPDFWVMFTLAGPMIALYFVAVGISWVTDWRRARRDGTAGLTDEEAAAIEEADAVEGPDVLEPAVPLERTAADDQGAAREPLPPRPTDDRAPRQV